MRTVTRYVAANGGEFNTAEEAIARENKLPDFIATYESDLKKFVAGNKFGGQVLTEEDAASFRQSWEKQIADSKALWAEIQKQRNGVNS